MDLIRTCCRATWQAVAPRRRGLICHRSPPFVRRSILAPDPKGTFRRSTLPDTCLYASVEPYAIRGTRHGRTAGQFHYLARGKRRPAAASPSRRGDLALDPRRSRLLDGDRWRRDKAHRIRSVHYRMEALDRHYSAAEPRRMAGRIREL